MAFERASSRLQRAPHEKETGQVLAMLDVIANPPRQLARLAIRSGERTFFVPVNDVDRIEALQNYVQVHVGATSHLLHVPMNTIETVLDPAALSAHPSFAHRERPTDCAALVGGARPVRHRAEVGRAPPFRPDLPRAHSRRPVESVLGSRALDEGHPVSSTPLAEPRVGCPLPADRRCAEPGHAGRADARAERPPRPDQRRAEHRRGPLADHRARDRAYTRVGWLRDSPHCYPSLPEARRARRPSWREVPERRAEPRGTGRYD